MAYLGKTPSQAVRSRYYFTATGGETSLSGADDNSNTLTFTDGNYVDVYLNGVLLVAATDYNTTTANTIAGLSALTASDVVEVVVYDTFSVFSGNVTGDFTVGGAFTSQGIDDNATSTAVTLDSSGNVGIGTSSPYSILGGRSLGVHNSSGASELNLLSSTTGFGALYFGDATSGVGRYAGYIEYKHDDDYFRFATNSSEKMRIDSSGNLLVGKTVQSIGTVGVTVVSGQVTATADGADAIRLNRKTSDGSIIDLRKDGTTVGSIGVLGGIMDIDGGSNLGVGAGDTGLLFTASSDDIRPFNVTTGATRDNAITLGSSSRRFKDLYLSGGVYLGGTGSANYLDDYEEGTWTPTANLGTVSGTNCVYRKIGSQVTVWGLLTSFSDRTSSNAIQIGGLPFSVDASSDDVAVGSAMWSFTDVDGGTVYIDSTTKLQFYGGSASSSYAPVNHNSLNLSSAAVYLCATYVAA
jgi:hypothetical protein